MRLGQFVLKRILGKGGMAQVWLAEHCETQALVAVKLMKAQFVNNVSLRARFLTEAKTIAALHHPNIIKLYDYGVVAKHTGSDLEAVPEGTPYYVMEYYPRGTLRDYLPALSWSRLKQYLLSILDALATAHSRGLVHRDLKPANILMGPRGPVISDFGIVYNVHDSLGVEGGGFIGTPKYMAPEQFREHSRFYGPWTDMYALGCLTYWLCTQRPPFEAATFAELLVSHLRHEPLPLEPRFSVPQSFEAWVSGCLRKDISLRPQLAADAAWYLVNLEGAMRTVEPGTEHTEHSDEQFVETMVLQTTLLWRSDSVLPVATEASSAVQVPLTWRRPKDSLPVHAAKVMGLSMVSMSQPPFVGRHDERDHLWSELVHSTQGSIRVVLVNGESGVGKSALMKWLAHRAHTLGTALSFNLSHSVASESASGIAGMLRDELRTTGLSGVELRAHVEHYCKSVGVYEDAELILSSLTPNLDADPDLLLQHARFAAVARLFCRLCEIRPRVLLVDDFQWQDETDAFLEYLIRANRNLRLLIVASQRYAFDRVAGVGATLVDVLQLGDALTSLELGRLDRPSHKELALSYLALTPDTAERLYDVSEGHPLMLQMILRDCVKRGLLQSSGQGYHWCKDQENEPLRRAVGGWLSPLTAWADRYPDLQSSLRLAACLGQEFMLVEWVDVCGRLGFDMPSEALDILIEEGFLAFDQYGRGSFAHPQCQEALVEVDGRGQDYLAYHGAIADMLASKREPDVWRLAEHYRLAGHYEYALEPLNEAWMGAIRQERFAFVRDVLLSWSSCLRQLGDSLHSPRWSALKLKWADYCGAVGRPGCARKHAAVLAARLERLPRSALHVEALLTWALAAKWEVGASQDNLRRIKRALTLAHEVQDPRLTARCIERYAVYLHTYGYLDRSLEQFYEALTLVNEHLDSSFAALVNRGLSRLLLDQGQVSEAALYGERALSLLHALTGSSFIASVQTTLGDIARRQADLETAQSFYSKAATIYKRFGNPDLWAACANLGIVCFDRGEWDLGLTWIAQGRAVATRVDNKAAGMMLESCELRGLAHLHRWSEFDSSLGFLMRREEHIYAQRDSADLLHVLGDELVQMNEHHRAERIRRLAALHFSALGL